MPLNTSHRPDSRWQVSSQVSEQAPGVFFVEGPASNWIIVKDETGFIIIDSGYPSDQPLVIQSIEHLGLRPADALAMLVTHGHIDHTGSAAYFSDTFGTPVLCSPEELAHVRGTEKHSVGFADVLPRFWSPRVVRWTMHAIKAGALSAKPATAARAWSADELRDLPGSPVAILVPGHTPGNAAILLPAAGAIITGDSFITGHPISRHLGPQLLHPMYHHKPSDVSTSLTALEGIEASLILPGHGSALAMPLGDVLASLRS